ncbi:MAG: hypothetical protein KIS76_07415 [Pyrinomonadaceae bacterium]|nr:hypothetical protein [Pyrinomonadaceae bacterium]
MSQKIYSTNPVVAAVISGTAPQPARMAAARGMLPIGQGDLLEILVGLVSDSDAELARTAQETLSSQESDQIKVMIASEDAAPTVLSYFIETQGFPADLQETVLINSNTPAKSIVKFARSSQNGSLLELLSHNQQLLISSPDIIEAIIANPARTPEALRRASEIKSEFFEKERGAQQIADELRAQGKSAAAEFIETAEFADDLRDESDGKHLTFEDAMLIAEHIETPDAEVDDSWLSLEYIEELYEETEEQREAIVNKILGDLTAEDDEISGERISMVKRILLMSMKDRVRLASKGDREARNILIRDPNRVVSQAVISNARITDQEVEKIASMRTVPDDVLRQIASNRNWARNYSIMHKLAQNPRTPISNVMSILTRLQLRDLKALNKNRNVSDAVRRQAHRLISAREGKR